jgi:hypothetical protein
LPFKSHVPDFIRAGRAGDGRPRAILSNIKMASAGGWQALALDNNGKVLRWGDGNDGTVLVWGDGYHFNRGGSGTADSALPLQVKNAAGNGALHLSRLDGFLNLLRRSRGAACAAR